MATIEWYDPETQCVKKARFQGEQPEHVTEALYRAQKYELLRAQGTKHEAAVAQLDREAEKAHASKA
jgi:hypothetical protein